MVLISVLLPFHGKSPYLGEAIESVLDQTLPDFELLLIGDRAPTSSTKLVKSFEERDARIKVIKSNGAGLGAALNTGLSYSSGLYIARLDDDDTMSRTRLDRQYREMAADPSLVCLGSQVLYIKDGVDSSTSKLPLHDWQIRFESKISNPMAHPSVLVRKTSLYLIGGYHQDFTVAQDYEMYTRLMSLGRIRNLSKPLTRYRIHEDQISSKDVKFRLPFELAAIESRHSPKSSIEASSTLLEKYLDSVIPEATFIESCTAGKGQSSAILDLREAVVAIKLFERVRLVLRAFRNSFYLSFVFIFSKFMTWLNLLTARKN